MRDKFKKKGMNTKSAKSKAARIYNSKHPDEPVGPGYEERKGKRRKPKISYPKR